ncbi:polyubiquitin-B-like, partial [Aphelenchoides avenae]
VKPSYTTKQVQLMLEEKGHATANCLRLIHGGKQLECHRTLSDYNVSKEQTIHMVGRLATPRRCGCVPE